MTRGHGVRLGLALGGLALAAWVVAGIDAAAAVTLVAGLGWSFLLVLAAAAAAFTVDAVSWHVLVPGLPLDARHGLRLWSARLVGEMLNTVTPLAGVGGEPAKAAILIRRFGLSPSDAIASVVAAKTTILLAFIPFLGIGFALMSIQTRIPDAYVVAVGTGFALFTVAIVAFFLVQRYRVASWLGARLRRGRWVSLLERALRQVRAVDREIERIYVGQPMRLAASLALAFLGWVLGAVELAVIAALMGAPLSLADTWMIEATVQLVRQAGGVIPGSLGVTEVAFALLFGAVTGSPALGVAVALVRRLREVVWIAGSLGLGAGYLRGAR